MASCGAFARLATRPEGRDERAFNCALRIVINALRSRDVVTAGAPSALFPVGAFPHVNTRLAYTCGGSNGVSYDINVFPITPQERL
jgi:hypothetical protein